MKKSLFMIVLLGFVPAVIGLIFSLILFVPPYQVTRTSEWPQEAQAILKENFPHGAITEDQWKRLRQLDKEMHFMTSLPQIVSRDILSGWWWFLLFSVAGSFLLNRKQRQTVAFNMAFMLPSGIVVLFAVLFGVLI